MIHSSVPRLALCAACALAAISPRAAEAATPILARYEARANDGVYHRFDGDLDLGFRFGSEFSAKQPAAVLGASAHYFSTAGVYVAYRAPFVDTSAPALFGVGVDLRPAFIPRWGLALERGPRFSDLALDSISLNLGAFWARPPARSFGDQRGFECGLGFGLPLFGRADSLWLETRATLRFSDLAAREQAILVALAFHSFLETPLLKN